MKPANIFVLRHGQSVGNVDKSIYETEQLAKDALAQAILRHKSFIGETITFVYGTRGRRLVQVVSATKEYIQCQDLDKKLPRRFTLSKITSPIYVVGATEKVKQDQPSITNGRVCAIHENNTLLVKVPHHGDFNLGQQVNITK